MHAQEHEKLPIKTTETVQSNPFEKTMVVKMVVGLEHKKLCVLRGVFDYDHCERRGVLREKYFSSDISARIHTNPPKLVVTRWDSMRSWMHVICRDRQESKRFVLSYQEHVHILRASKRRHACVCGTAKALKDFPRGIFKVGEKNSIWRTV